MVGEGRRGYRPFCGANTAKQSEGVCVVGINQTGLVFYAAFYVYSNALCTVAPIDERIVCGGCICISGGASVNDS